MATIFENLIIDRPLDGVFRDAEGNVLGGLNQIQNLSINVTSESKDKTDATGVLIKRFFTSKQAEISAENAIFSLSLMGLQTGSGKQTATSTNKIILPIIRKFKREDIAAGVALKVGTQAAAPITGSISVTGLTADGIPDTSLRYEEDTTTAATPAEGKWGYDATNDKLKITFAAADTTAYIQVVYEYESQNGVKVLETADKFPKECELTMSVLVCDACDKEVVRHAYIVFPAFQMSPDFDLSVATDAAHAFSGIASVDYCSPDKSMFYIAMSEDDVDA